MRTDGDWHIMFRAGAASMPWRDEYDAVEWAESLNVNDALVGEFGLPAYMLFLSKPELELTAAGLRRLARTRPADSDWLEDFATDLESDAAGIDGSIVRSNVPSGIHPWSFESRSVWWFGELAKHDARTLVGALAGRPPAELPILWSTIEVRSLSRRSGDC